MRISPGWTIEIAVLHPPMGEGYPGLPAGEARVGVVRNDEDPKTRRGAGERVPPTNFPFEENAKNVIRNPLWAFGEKRLSGWSVITGDRGTKGLGRPADIPLKERSEIDDPTADHRR